MRFFWENIVKGMGVAIGFFLAIWMMFVIFQLIIFMFVSSADLKDMIRNTSNVKPRVSCMS